jgi:protein-S-isoprenylcysteine O-methyltransferase Ste14
MSPPEKDRAGVIAPPPLIYAAFWGLGWLGRKLLRVDIPHAELIGAALCVVAIAFGLAAAWELHRARTTIDPFGATTAIVRSGPYRVTRNPLYVSLALFYAGLALIAHAFPAILLLPVALLVMTYGVIRREELYLERKFGVEYREYRHRVRRWL